MVKIEKVAKTPKVKRLFLFICQLNFEICKLKKVKTGSEGVKAVQKFINGNAQNYMKETFLT